MPFFSISQKLISFAIFFLINAKKLLFKPWKLLSNASERKADIFKLLIDKFKAIRHCNIAVYFYLRLLLLLISIFNEKGDIKD